MGIRPIKTEDDSKNALLRIEALMDATPDSKAGAELDVLATLVDAYEARNFPIKLQIQSKRSCFAWINWEWRGRTSSHFLATGAACQRY